MQRFIYTLEDVEKRAHDCFPMFQVADRSTRERLQVGMVAKLIFVSATDRAKSSERLWVRITRLETGKQLTYYGELLSEPMYFSEDELKRGDTVWFGPEHISEWDVSEP